MRLAIDCRGLRTSPSGIPNFVVTAINGISALRPDWELYLLANDTFNEDLDSKLVKRDNVIKVIEPLKLLPNYAIIWYFTKVESIVKRIDPDVFWAPAFLLPPFLPKNVKTLVTVHDMVFKQYKDTMSGMNRLFFELLHDRSVKQADMLWTNSEYTKAGVEHYFRERACRDIFSGFFIDTDRFRPVQVSEQQRTSLLAKFGQHDKFILFVGTLEPRKNLSFLLSLMPALAKLGYSLLVIGAKGWGDTQVKAIVEAEDFPREQVHFAGYVTSEELVQIYNIASVYVSTSLNEGFGMPQLEAMACGCPVVSPHNSAMIEVVEGAGETVKTWEEADWIEAIVQVDQNRMDYIAAGYMRVKEYERDTVIQNLTDYIERHMAPQPLLT
ncbi:glycosyltransferase family 4 protein [Pontibacter roseus]|uniref:glycosyltransferase family 4 protein n=1 Tax=Pontibacter roseus TaxID=336989 RepID=UPI0012F913B2|nr:glycosyltransferase family 1 protein [Pontibacter roseus]